MTLSASGAKIWRRCPGSGLLSAMAPKVDRGNSASLEGKLAHTIAEYMFNKGIKSVPFLMDLFKDATEDMCTDTANYVSYVNSFNTVPGGIKVETIVPCSKIFKGISDGNVDAYISDKENQTLHVFDLKYGYRYVEVEKNDQLMIYAASLWRAPKVVLHIYQPRSYDGARPDRSFTIDKADLDKEIGLLKSDLSRVSGGDPFLHTGTHCLYCKGRWGCKALREKVSSGVAFTRGFDFSVSLDSEDASVSLALMEQTSEELKYIITGMKEILTQKLKDGEPSTLYRYTLGRGNSVWDVSPGIVKELGEQFNVETSQEKLISPAQAKKKGIPEKIVDSMITRPITGAKLRKVSKKKAQMAFGKKK